MTICPSCRFTNPPGMHFCGNCGARLENTGSPHPGPAPSQAETLGIMMGADLLERFRRAGLEAGGQRRNVTVLFADLSDYTHLAEQLDNEDVYDLIQQFIRMLANDVYTYEGIVDKLTGDGLMALYGAPIAHENNAERAVRSAMDMQASLENLARSAQEHYGIDLRMRIGLHSGSVIVGGVGSDLLMNYTAIGDTVNLARRLQEHSNPGEILVSEMVQRQTRRIFDYELVPNLTLKGISQPTNGYKLAGIKPHPESVRGLEGLRSPMVGRETELNRLQEAMDWVLERRSGSLVVIKGEAGIGKSRLIHELKSLVEARGDLRVLEGASLTYRRSVSYWIFLDLLRGYLGITPETPEAEVSQRLAARTAELFGSHAAEQVPYFDILLGLKPSNTTASERMRYLDAGQLRQHIFLAVRDLLVAESQRRPLLLILEDLHWADEASLDLLHFLLDALRNAPILVVAITRPIQEGGLSKIMNWAGNQIPERLLVIQLHSLSPDQSSSLLTNLLAISAFPADLRQYILQRAAGVPYYLEEILRMLIDRNLLQRQGSQWRLSPIASIASLGVPDTLQGLILARFDRLDEFQRRILQVAAVIGHRFSLHLLRAMLDHPDDEALHRALSTMVAREYIHPISADPHPAYVFRHMLMSEAIYSTLLKRDRARLHELAGQSIEQLYANRLDEQVEILARHYSWSNNQERALHYLVLAGKKAASSYMNEDSRQHFEQALTLLPQVEHSLEQALQIYNGLGDLQALLGEYPVARQLFVTALQTINIQDPGRFVQDRSSLERKIAKTFERQGDHEKALQHLALAQECLDLAPAPLPVERAQILNDTGWLYFRQGNFPEAQRLLSEALAQVEETNAYDAIASIYNRLGGLAYNQGDWNRTAGYLRKSIAIRESIGDLVGLATSFNNLGLLGIEMGDFDNALENLTRSYELKRRLGQAEGISMALSNLGWLRFERGEIEEAKLDLSQALEVARQIGYTALAGQALKNFGELYLVVQDWENARIRLQESLDTFIELEAHDQQLDAYRLLGEAALGAGDLQSAAECLDQIQKLALSLENETTDLTTVQRGELWRFRGMLAGHQGDWEKASSYLRESEKIFQALGSRLYQGRAALQLGALAEAQGDRNNARLRYREAALLFNSVGARIEEARAQEAYQRLNN